MYRKCFAVGVVGAVALGLFVSGPTALRAQAPEVSSMEPPRYVAVVLLEFLPAWLAMTREERNAAVARLGPILERHPDVTLRWVDADGLGHGYTDFAICEFSDLEQYHFLWEELRDTELFTRPLVVMKDVLLGLEDGFRRFEGRGAAGGAGAPG